MTEKTSPNEDYSILIGDVVRAFSDLGNSIKESSKALGNLLELPLSDTYQTLCVMKKDFLKSWRNRHSLQNGITA